MPLNSNSLDLSSVPYLCWLVSSEAQRCQLVRKPQILWKRHSITSCDRGLALDPAYTERGDSFCCRRATSAACVICSPRWTYGLPCCGLSIAGCWLRAPGWVCWACAVVFSSPAQAWLRRAEQRAKGDGRRSGRHKVPVNRMKLLWVALGGQLSGPLVGELTVSLELKKVSSEEALHQVRRLAYQWLWP